jgi:hypothetical protein
MISFKFGISTVAQRCPDTSVADVHLDNRHHHARPTGSVVEFHHGRRKGRKRVQRNLQFHRSLHHTVAPSQRCVRHPTLDFGRENNLERHPAHPQLFKTTNHDLSRNLLLLLLLLLLRRRHCKLHLRHPHVREMCLYCTCWWYSLCNFQYRQHDEHTMLGSL